jgi:hypothetical protein
MSKSIRISEKHGVNPTLGICMYCGEETGEIALLGCLPGDKEAPRQSILSIKPCQKCIDRLTQESKIILVAMDEQIPIKWVELSTQCLNPNVSIPPERVALMRIEQYNLIFKQ